MPQREDLAAFEHEAADDAHENDDGTDDLDHVKPTNDCPGTTTSRHPYRRVIANIEERQVLAAQSTVASGFP